MTTQPALPRIAIVTPYTDFWESATPGSLRDGLAAVQEEVGERLATSFEVAEAAIVGSRADGTALARRLADGRLDAVLVLQVVAVMPAYALAAIGGLPATTPLVLWAARRRGRVADTYDHPTLTTDGATVGIPMLTNPLVRAGRPFELVVGLLDDRAAHHAVERALVAAAAASRLGRARIGRVGAPIDGYDCVTVDDASLRQLVGTTVVPIEPREVLERYRAVEPVRVEALRDELHAGYDVAPDLDPDALERSLRAAVALDDVVRGHELDAGALNCHVPEIRFGEEIGIAPCFGLGRLTTRGVPWSCAGDLPVAFAMLLLKALGGAAAYHELEAFDDESGEFVIANTGEHDLAFGDGRRPRVVANHWFHLDPHCGVCACVGGPAGPASLLAFAELDVPQRRYRLIVADGELTGRSFPSVTTISGAFRFGGGQPAEAWARWCRAGVSHHSAATPGSYADEIESVGRHLAIEVVRV